VHAVHTCKQGVAVINTVLYVAIFWSSGTVLRMTACCSNATDTQQLLLIVMVTGAGMVVAVVTKVKDTHTHTSTHTGRGSRSRIACRVLTTVILSTT